MKPSSAKVASRWKSARQPNLKQILKDLNTLQELDENLTEIEDTFSRVYRTKLAKVSPEVESQFDVLDLSKKALNHAKEIQRSLESLLEHAPEDKTALRAYRDADVMVRRFERHRKAAAKIIRTLSKKEMPPDLVKAAKSFGAALKKELKNPKLLQVLPWQIDSNNSQTGTTGVRYQMVFRLPLQPGMLHGKPEVILSQSTVHEGGVRYGPRKQPYSLDKALQLMLDQLEGWDGLKGFDEAVAFREQYIEDIVDEVEGAAFRIGERYYRQDAEVSPDKRTVEIAFRTDNYGDSGDEWEDANIENHYLQQFKKGLHSYGKIIKDMHVHAGGKGWWFYTLNLK